MSRGHREFWDPAGARFGVPTWPWRMAPSGLATRRQLAAAGLRPAGRPPAGKVCWTSRRRSPGRRPRTRFALVYWVELAAARRGPTPAQLVALAKADPARRTRPCCGRVQGYVIPLSLGECLDCDDGWAAGEERDRRPRARDGRAA